MLKIFIEQKKVIVLDHVAVFCYPSSEQITSASTLSKLSEQMPPQSVTPSGSLRTSTRPTEGNGPSTIRINSLLLAKL